MTVVAFLIFPAHTNSFNVDSFRAQAIVKQLRETVNSIQGTMGHRLFEMCLRGQIPEGSDLLHQVCHLLVLMVDFLWNLFKTILTFEEVFRFLFIG